MSILYNLWGLITLASVIWVIYDVTTMNRGLDPIKKVLWVLVAIFLGVLGAIIYYLVGKK